MIGIIESNKELLPDNKLKVVLDFEAEKKKKKKVKNPRRRELNDFEFK